MAESTRTIYGNALILPSKKEGANNGSKETWVLNNTINTASAFSFSASFVSNGVSYTGLRTGTFTPSGRDLVYINSSGSTTKIYGADVNTWMNQAYRKLTFDTPPTGDLLTWLQANGVKQPDDTAVQNNKTVNITSNSTISVTPDAPYDALKKVIVAVNVVSEGGETTSVEVYGNSGTIDMPIFCTWQTENGWLGTNEFNIANANDDYLFTIENVLVGGYIIFTKDPTDSAFFRVEEPNGVEALDVNPMSNSSTSVNASVVIKVIDPGCSFKLSISAV